MWGIYSNMKAEGLLRERHQLRGDAFVELRIRRVPGSVPASLHEYKYSLAYGVGGECVLRYDNEAGKGDHRHIGGRESHYAFTSPDDLLRDFWQDIDQWQPE